MTNADTTRADRRQEYQTVLRVIELNTGGKQRPMAPMRSIRKICGYGGIDTETVDKRVQAAVENGDLLRDGGRVCLADAEQVKQRVADTDEAVLLRMLLRAETSGPCREAVVGAINERLLEVQENG